jgi:hypothetical protein
MGTPDAVRDILKKVGDLQKKVQRVEAGLKEGLDAIKEMSD